MNIEKIKMLLEVLELINDVRTTKNKLEKRVNEIFKKYPELEEEWEQYFGEPWQRRQH